MKTITKLVCVSFLSLCVTAGKAQIATGELTIGGTTDDRAYQLVQTKDGGYAIGGKTNSYGLGFYDYYMAKLDTAGNLQWSRTLGGTNYDYAYSLIQTNDGGYAMAGVSVTYSVGSDDFYIVKTDAKGIIQWTTSIGWVDAEDAYSIIQTSDGGYAVAGSTRSFGLGNDAYIVKLSSAGAKVWTRTFNTSWYTYPNQIIETRDKGLVITGTDYSTATGHYDIFTFKLDSVGTMKWTSRQVGSLDDYGHSVVQTPDGGFAIAGTTDSYGAGSNDMCIIRLDTAGKMLWSKTIGGKLSDGGSWIVNARDGGFVITGVTDSWGSGGYDAYVVKLNSAGNIEWTRVIGGTGDDETQSIVLAKDGGYAIAGFTNSYGAGSYDMWFLKLDSTGNYCGASIIDSGRIASAAFPAPYYTGGGPTSIDSGTVKHGGVNDSGAVYMNNCSYMTYVQQVQHTTASTRIVPNPNNGKFTMEVNSEELRTNSSVEIYNVLGEKIYSTTLGSKNSTLSIDISGKPAGIYVYRLITADGKVISSGKLAIQ